MPARRVPSEEKADKPPGDAGILWLQQREQAVADAGGVGIDWANIPEPLDDVALAKWTELASRFADQPTRLREGSRDLVILYVQTWSIRQAALAQVSTQGPTIPGRSPSDKGRPVKHPGLQTIRDMTVLLIRISRELGFGEDSAGRLGLRDAQKGGGDDGYDPFAPPRRGREVSEHGPFD